jgi:hypothetical protein
MLELKRELEALADQWHNYIGGGTMTNKEHAAQLRKIIAKHDFEIKEVAELVVADQKEETTYGSVKELFDANRDEDGVLKLVPFTGNVSQVVWVKDCTQTLTPSNPKSDCISDT